MNIVSNGILIIIVIAIAICAIKYGGYRGE